MHAYVHCSTVHNGKDIESTQMAISDRRDKENVVHVYHGILCSHKKEQDHVLCRDIDGAGGHYLEQSNAGTENQILHVLTYKCELNYENTWTHGGEQHTLGPVGGLGVGGGKAPGRTANKCWALYLGDRMICTANYHDTHLPM